MEARLTQVSEAAHNSEVAANTLMEECHRINADLSADIRAIKATIETVSKPDE